MAFGSYGNSSKSGVVDNLKQDITKDIAPSCKTLFECHHLDLELGLIEQRLESSIFIGQI